MILLNKHSLDARGSFTPETMQLTLAERQSTATITVRTGPDMPAIAVGDWLQDNTDPGAGTVWRVKSIDTDYNKLTRTYQLEHIINTLKDTVMFGEVTTAMLGGGDARAAVRYVLDRQADWTLGVFGYDGVTNDYAFNGDTLMAALETIDGTLEDAFWTLNTTVYPFRLSIRPLNGDLDSEMRMDRNIQTARMTVDVSRMYTRFYPIGSDNLHISGDYVQKNTQVYGVISKVETDQSITSEAALRKWAQNKLRRHCDPTVSVNISGFDLSAATGEPLDRLRVGRLCRVPLPDFGTTIQSHIKKLVYRDKIATPEAVAVTIANEREDATRILSRVLNESSTPGGRGGRTSAKKNEEDHAWFVDTTDHVAMVAEAVAGEGADKDWSRVSRIVADGGGLHLEVKKAQGDIIECQSNIEVHEDFIDLTTKAIGADGKITAATIATSINKNGSNALISADHISLNGSVTVGGVMRISGNDLIVGRNIQTGLNGGYVQTNSVKLIGGSSAQGANVVTLNAGTMATAVQSATVSGNELKLKLFNGQTVNFSKATALSGGWSRGKFTVTAKPQGSTFWTLLEPGSKQWGSDGVIVDVNARNGNQQNVLINTGFRTYANVRPNNIEIKTSGVTGWTNLGTYTVTDGCYLCFKIGDLQYYFTIRT